MNCPVCKIPLQELSINDDRDHKLTCPTCGQRYSADNKYDVVYSGHGSRYMADGVLLFDKTLEECEKLEIVWELRADTIGGRAWTITKEQWKEYDKAPY